jgi:hypothetical protein
MASQLGNLPRPHRLLCSGRRSQRPEVEKERYPVLWFWISLIGILLFGFGLIPAAVLFFILIYAAGKPSSTKACAATRIR